MNRVNTEEKKSKAWALPVFRSFGNEEESIKGDREGADNTAEKTMEAKREIISRDGGISHASGAASALSERRASIARQSWQHQRLWWFWQENWWGSAIEIDRGYWAFKFYFGCWFQTCWKLISILVVFREGPFKVIRLWGPHPYWGSMKLLQNEILTKGQDWLRFVCLWLLSAHLPQDEHREGQPHLLHTVPQPWANLFLCAINKACGILLQ